MSDVIRIKFDRQEGDNYYFLVGFYDSGIDLSFGTSAFPSQHTILEVLGKVPPSFFQGQQVGTYTIPVHIYLRGIRSRPWIWETDLLPDLATNWFDMLGYLYLEWYECLYRPSEVDLMPSPYQEKFDTALSHPSLDGYYNLPLLVSQWPSDETEYTSQDVAHSVSLEGSQLMPEWSSLWSGSDEWHMLTLIGTQPKLPQEPNILTRWRAEHASSGMKRSEGSFDDRFPLIEFKGWDSPFSNAGLIDILPFLQTSLGDLVINQYTGVIIPYLSPTRTGDQVVVKIPKALSSVPPEDNESFIFPDEPVEPEPVALHPVFHTLPQLLGFFLLALPPPGPSQSPWVPYTSFKIGAKDTSAYGIAGSTYAIAGSTYPVAGPEL